MRRIHSIGEFCRAYLKSMRAGNPMNRKAVSNVPKISRIINDENHFNNCLQTIWVGGISRLDHKMVKPEKMKPPKSPLAR